MSKGKVKVERRRVNPYFLLVNDGAFAEGGNIIDGIEESPNNTGGVGNAIASNPQAVGNIGAGASQIAGNAFDQNISDPSHRNNVVANSIGENFVKSSGAGLAAGSAFGPWGMLIGAAVGGTYGAIKGGIQGSKEKKAYMESKEGIYAALGATLPGNPIDQLVGESVDSIEGPSHEEGGIQITRNAEVEGNEAKVGNEILSDRLTNPLTGRTFAEDAKRIEKKYIRDNDSYSNKAKAAEIAKLIELNKVEREKQEALDQEIAGDYHAYGGSIKKGANGKWDIDISMRKAITEAAKARGLGVNDYASKLFALGGSMGGPGNPPAPSSTSYSQADIQRFMAQDSKNKDMNADLTGATLLSDPTALNAYYSEYGNANAGKRIWSTPSGGYVVGGVDPTFAPSKKTSTVTPSTPSTQDNTQAHFIMNASGKPQWVDPITYNSHTGQKTTLPLDASGYPVTSGGLRYTEYDKSPTGVPAYNRAGTFALGGPLDEFEIPSGEVSSTTTKQPLPKMTTSDEMFNEYGEFTGDPADNQYPEGFTYDPIESDLGFDPTADYLNESESVSKKRKIGSQELGLLASNLPALDNMLKSTNVEKTKYEKYTPETLDLSEVRTRNQRDTDMARKAQNEIIRGNANSSGEALSALSAGNAALTSGQMEADLTSLLQEKSANNAIRNQAGQVNTQISNQENDANAQNRAMAKGLGNMALSDVGMNTQGYMRDKTLTEADLQKNTTLLQTINAIAPNYKC